MASKRKAYVLGGAILAAAALAWVVISPGPQDNEKIQEISLAIASPLQACGDIPDGVVGMHSPLPDADDSFLGRLTKRDRVARMLDRISRARKSLLARVQTPHESTIRLSYTVDPTAMANGLELQDISLALPNRFHKEAQYELACRKTSSDSSPVVYRKFLPKMHNQNYEEPPVSLIPRDCIGAAGEIVIRASDYGDMDDIVAELKTSVLRAVLWNPKSRVVNPQALEVFAPQVSYRPGDHVTFHAHATDEQLPGTLELVRVGRDVTSWKKIENLPLKKQQVSSYSYRDGLDWPATTAVDLPQDIPTGYYVAVLRQGDEKAAFPFVVRPASGDKTTIAIIAATNTWQAYNGWGGGSLYKNVVGKACLDVNHATLISAGRPAYLPYPLDPATKDDHLFRAEKQIAQWLEENGIDYAVYTDDDLHSDPRLLDNHAIALLPSHPEYYTTQMYDSLDRHAARGGNILYLGGNALYYRITRTDKQIEKHTNGRLHDLDPGFGGFWSKHLDRSPAALLGNEYDAGDYDTHAPYVVKKADHPVFAGTGLADGDTFGDDGAGHEMDIITDKSPANVVLLAKGANPAGFGSDMVLIDHPAGGKVFSAGSISFAYALVHDEKTGTLLKNVIRLMLPPETVPDRP